MRMRATIISQYQHQCSILSEKCNRKIGGTGQQESDMNILYKILTIGMLLPIMIQLSGIIQISVGTENVEKNYMCIDKGVTDAPPSAPESVNRNADKEFTNLCDQGKVPKVVYKVNFDISLRRVPGEQEELATCNSGACYDWANSRQLVTNTGAIALLTQHDPSIDQINGIHSLSEIGVSSSTSPPGNFVEVGWRKTRGDVTRLFIFWWKDDVPKCYNSDCTGWVQVSNRYYPGMPLAVDNNGKYYAIQYRYGDWWIWYNDEWIGYYPSSLWNYQFTQGSAVLYYGEVLSEKIMSSSTDMGNGLWASNPDAAKIFYQQYLSEPKGWLIANTEKSETSRNLYTAEPSGQGNMRYGGPGIDGYSSIELLSPNGGESVETNHLNYIKWKYDGSVGPYVKLELFKGGVLDKTLISFFPIGNGGLGTYHWGLTDDQPLGNDYRIKVTSSSNPIYQYDESDSDFTITSPSIISLISPNGGETWVRGTPHTITWNSLGTPGANVKIDLLKSGTVVGTVTSGTPNDGSHQWTISSGRALGSDYNIRVTSTSDTSHTDTSNNNFIIGGINVNSPNGGENWARGSYHTIKWSKLGNPGPNVRIDLLKNGAVVGTVTSSTPNDGVQGWTVSLGRAPGIDYKIRVMSTTNSAYKDTSNNNFRIS